MSGASPPKPWETARAGGASGNTSSASLATYGSMIADTRAAAVPTSTSVGTATADSSAPALPARPDSLSSIANRTASNYSSPMNRPGMASSYSSPYGMGGGMGGYGSYSSPYSRFGGMGGYGGGMYSSPYGGMGGYGGAYGGGMYGQPGMYGPNGQEQSLTQTFSQSTQTTFHMIESIVGAFGGFAQMLESTYMATHSSFFAMVSVAEQFGNLRQTLGSVLGIFTLMRWIRTAIARLTGRPPPANSKELTPANFASFSGGNGGVGPDGQPRPSKKPFIVFMLAVFGLPYLMGKLIRALAASQEAEQQRQLANAPYGADGQQQPLDPSKLDFCRVLYDYTPQMQPGQQMQEGLDLEVKKGDLVAVLSKTDPMGAASDWWRCRARNGQMGYLPSPYLETIQRRPAGQKQLDSKAAPASEGSSPMGSRLNTMTSGGSRANSMPAKVEKEPVKVKPKVEGKPNDVSVESFQKGGFYS